MSDKTVAMVRDADLHPAPHSADVHPAEVDNYKAGGWIVADPLDRDGDGNIGGSKPRSRTKAAG